MAYTVEIREDRLLDILEDEFGDVYENIQEDDTITSVKVRAGYVYITIGEEED